MQKVLLALAILFTACDGQALIDYGCTSESLQAPNNGCVWGLPAGARCDDLNPAVNGVVLAQDAYSVVCSSGSLVLIGDACATAKDGVVAIVVCPANK